MVSYVHMRKYPIHLHRSWMLVLSQILHNISLRFSVPSKKGKTRSCLVIAKYSLTLVYSKEMPKDRSVCICDSYCPNWEGCVTQICIFSSRIISHLLFSSPLYFSSFLTKSEISIFRTHFSQVSEISVLCFS